MKNVRLLRYAKQTYQMHRWDDFDSGFELYIPKWRVPEPLPLTIQVLLCLPGEYKPTVAVEISSTAALPTNYSPIVTDVKFCEEHTKTVRYESVGDQKTWQIGSPYVPKVLLDGQPPVRLTVVVEWM